MSKRAVHDVQRIVYWFSREELLDVLLSHGEDCRGNGLLPGPKAVWTDDGVELVYEYKTEKKDEPLPKGSPCVRCGAACVGRVAQAIHDADGCSSRQRAARKSA